MADLGFAMRFLLLALFPERTRTRDLEHARAHPPREFQHIRKAPTHTGDDPVLVRREAQGADGRSVGVVHGYDGEVVNQPHHHASACTGESSQAVCLTESTDETLVPVPSLLGMVAQRATYTNDKDTACAAQPYRVRPSLASLGTSIFT